MAFTKITVTFAYANNDGSGATGTVQFTPTASMANGGVIVAANPATIQLVNGAGSIILDANDDPGTSPSGVGYLVQEFITGATQRTYTVVIPRAVTPLDLSTLAPALSNPVYSYATSAALTAEITRATAAEATKLAIANNLSDLASATSARTNLGAAADTAVVHNTGVETVAGVKTFSSAPVVPANAFPESAVANLVAALAARPVTAVPAAYTSAAATGIYDQRMNVFNLKASNSHNLRAALGKAKAGTALTKIAFCGDSTTAGYTALAATQSIPIVVRDLLAQNLCTIAGTGPVVGNPGGGPGGFLDGRWTFTGTWTTQAANSNFLYQTIVSGASALFTSDKAGTVAEIRYMNNGGAFTYSIDGAAAVTVTPSGAGTMATVTVTGLAATTHTILITTTTVTAFYLVWASVRNVTGVQIANFGVCASSTADWVNTLFYYPGTEAAAWAPNVTFINLGINDVAAGTPIATIQANLQTLITQFKALGDVVMVVQNPHQSLDFAALNLAKYQLAISSDIPLIDLFDRWGSYAISNPLGLYNDSIHPTAAGYADLGRTVFDAIL